ncbi:peptidylprolyl isomerase [Candidatus Neomarinimicrobiota bacterium]
MNNLYFSLHITLFCLLIISCGGSNNGTDHQQAAAMKVNGIAVTDAEFTRRYMDFLTYTSLPDDARSRYGFSDALADEMLLFEWADSTHFFDHQTHSDQLKAIKDQALLNLLYNIEIKSSIDIQESYLRQIYQWSKISLHTRHLFARDYDTAKSIHDQLVDGASWTELATIHFSDPALSSNGGDLGYHDMGELDPAFEVAAYGLDDGEFSEPVQTEYGYSIIQVVEREINPFTIESEFVQAKKKLELMAWTYLRRPAVKAYTDSIIIEMNIEFDEATLNALPEQIDLGVLEMETVLNNEESLVSFDQGRLSLASATAQILQLPLHQRDRITSRALFVDAVSGLLVQSRLLQRAQDMNLDDMPEYLAETAKSIRQYKLRELISSITDDVSIPVDSIVTYYTATPDEYQTAPRFEMAEIVLPSKSVADSTRNLINDGHDFGLLASTLSVRKESAVRNGYLGWGTAEQFGSLGNRLGGAMEGDVLGPFQVQDLFVILQVHDLEPARRLTLEEATPLIEQQLTPLFKRKAYEGLRALLRSNATIEIDSTFINSRLSQEIRS